MIVSIYRLKFETPIHFGAAELGGNLEAINFSYTSDTLFSALCSELARDGDAEILSQFIKMARDGKFILSDLLPYKTGGETFYYLPKPIITVKREKILKRTTLSEMREQATQRKRQKKIEYVRVSRVNEFLSAMKSGAAFSESNDFGNEELAAKVAMRGEESLPYYVAKFSFHDDSGLYLAAAVDSEKIATTLEEILQYVGATGIGGKRSSGYGKFFVAEKIILPNDNADLIALQKMLADDSAQWQMTISGVLPTTEDISILQQSYYRIKRRSGFVTTQTGEFERKKNSIYMLSAGSCFPKRIDGQLILLDNVNGHEVLRLGRGLFVGLNL